MVESVLEIIEADYLKKDYGSSLIDNYYQLGCSIILRGCELLCLLASMHLMRNAKTC